MFRIYEKRNQHICLQSKDGRKNIPKYVNILPHLQHFQIILSDEREKALMDFGLKEGGSLD
jgi:hypothetical protein